MPCGRPGDDDDDDETNGRVYGQRDEARGVAGRGEGRAPEKKHYSRKTHFFLYQKVSAYLEKEHVFLGLRAATARPGRGPTSSDGGPAARGYERK